MIEPFSRRPRRTSRLRPALWAAGLTILICVAAGAAALLAWPEVSLGTDVEALADVSQPGYAGRISRVVVRRPNGEVVAVRLRRGKIWPSALLPAGERLAVRLTVRRPGWAGWLVGHSETRSFTIRTPGAHLRGRWLEIAAGRPVTVSFDAPVRVVRLRTGSRAQTLRLDRPRRVVPIGVVAQGSNRLGTVLVSAVARTWERLPPPLHVNWFPVRDHAQMLAEPAPAAELTADRPITLTFSRTVRAALGKRLPTIDPAVAGSWRRLDSHTLSFRPSGLGYPLGTDIAVRLPQPVALATAAGERLTRKLVWHAQGGTILRLEQLLAEAGYLPVGWSPDGDPVERTPHAELAAVADPPAGRFHWPYATKTPPELRALWQTGVWNEIVRGAVMMFEDTHGLDVDGFVGPKVWHALLADAIAGRRRSTGYSYVYVHRSVPQSLNLWHEGETILSSPGNTGVPAAPTQLGTFPVFEHIPVGTMSGTNPDGSHYNDPGIRWISYFNHGDAIHAFNRASFGTPQSLGCVELPLDAAAKVWPYTPIGTLVTIED